MKPLFCFRLIALCISVASVAHSVEAVASAPGLSAQSSMAGKYVGTWSNGEESGKLWLTFKPDGEGWTVESTFTYQDAEIAAKIVSVKVDGTKLELVLDWEIQGGAGRSSLVGQIGATTIDGIYDTKTADNTSSGTWTVTRS